MVPIFALGAHAKTKSCQKNIIARTAECFIKKNIHTLKAPGGIIGVVYKNALLIKYPFGYATLETKKPVTSETLFRLFSISKTFGGLALALLKDQRLLTYDDPIETYLPEGKNLRFEKSDKPVTIRHLITHTSGLAQGHGDEMQSKLLQKALQEMNDQKNPSSKNVLEWLKVDARLSFEPGTDYQYSNLGFIVTGALIEKIAQQAPELFVKEKILKPLGMKNTVFHENDPNQNIRSYGYNITPNGTFEKINDNYATGFYILVGGAYSNLEDLAAYIKFLLGNKTCIPISPKSLQEIFTPIFAKSPHGVAWEVKDNKKLGTRSVFHSGGCWGYNAALALDPNHKVGIIVLTNSGGTKPKYKDAETIALSLLEALQEALI
jgi:CubicO group peptidase (beta-lactamase class C family)